jgi:threonine/homoserine/homoserine lactone efflux protein
MRGAQREILRMPPHDKLAIFFAASLVLLFTPGPAVLYIVTRAVEQGRIAGVVSALGITLGTLVHVAAAALGLSALLVSSASLFSVVKYLGAAYLIYLGVRRLLGSGNGEGGGESAAQPLGRVFTQGIWVNVLNPKTAVFFFAFLPQFVDVARGAVGRQVAALGICFALLGLTSDCLYALAAGSLAARLKRSPRFAPRLRWVSGSVYLGLGVAAAVAGTRRK